MADLIYNRFKANLMNKEVDLGTGGDTIKVALMATGHSASTVADNVWADVSTNEMINDSGTAYTAGGATLGSQTVTQAATTIFDGADTVWGSGDASFSAFYAVLYDDTMTNDDLICSFDLSGPQTVASGTFTITWHASNGIITMA